MGERWFRSVFPCLGHGRYNTSGIVRFWLVFGDYVCSYAHYVNRMWDCGIVFFLFWVGLLPSACSRSLCLRLSSPSLRVRAPFLWRSRGSRGWGFWGEIVAMSVNGVMWEISEIEGSFL